jgi:hypothetical protein
LPSPPPPPPPRPWVEDFESVAVGKVPTRFGYSPSDRSDAIQVTTEAAASGKNSLKFTKTPGLQYGFQPHVLFSSERYRTGKVRFACDLMNSATQPSEFYVGLRDYTVKGREYVDGPSIVFKPDGTVAASDKPIATVPRGQWIHLEIVLDLGQPGQPGPQCYRLAITPAGGQERVFEKLPFAMPEFKQFSWFGFSSVGKIGSVFYVDNVRLELVDVP